MTTQSSELITDAELQAASGGFVGLLVKVGKALVKVGKPAGKYAGKGAAAYGGYKGAEAIDQVIDQAIG